jgi:hypothetical protein
MAGAPPYCTTAAATDPFLLPGSQDGSAEPNNKEAPEECSAGNYTQAFDQAWGWSDTRCDRKQVFMCKLIRTCQDWSFSVLCSSCSQHMPGIVM